MATNSVPDDFDPDSYEISYRFPQTHISVIDGSAIHDSTQWMADHEARKAIAESLSRRLSSPGKPVTVISQWALRSEWKKSGLDITDVHSGRVVIR